MLFQRRSPRPPRNNPNELHPEDGDTSPPGQARAEDGRPRDRGAPRSASGGGQLPVTEQDTVRIARPRAGTAPDSGTRPNASSVRQRLDGGDMPAPQGGDPYTWTWAENLHGVDEAAAYHMLKAHDGPPRDTGRRMPVVDGLMAPPPGAGTLQPRAHKRHPAHQNKDGRQPRGNRQGTDTPASMTATVGPSEGGRNDGASSPPVGQPQAANHAPGAQPGQQAAVPPIIMPDRPQRSARITLKGQMKESGFVKEPWLADRGGGYIQLTELLYRIAEQADGRRTADEIADAVSEQYGKRVSADNVRQLVTQKLIPLGVIVNGDGQEFGRTGGNRGALSVNFKMAMIDPRYIAPFTAVLQWLYWPPVLSVMLVAGAAAEWWLFARHGLGGSVREALYSPGLLLGALGLIVLAAAFHELGHAAALRYGGGKVRGMGAGLYLVYPAFYTDVSDNYRLGRWAKVRTDLGGFYFNILFALGLMALYAATGFELLLIAVVLINLDIVRQSMPFVRLDGYWALADVTGVPDFFTNIGAFLRSVLPLPFWQGRKLPELKTWVRAVFFLYLLVTIPLLILLLFATIRSVPRILATAWDSGRGLAGEFSAAQGASDVLGMLAATVQMLTLALPTLGVLYMIYALAKGLSRFVWNWSRGSAPKRALGLSGLGVLAVLVALLWLPQVTALLPGPAGRSGPFYQAGAWQPIQPGERGTIGDAVRDVPVAGNVVSRFSPPSSSAPTTGTPAGEATPAATARPDATGTLAATSGAGANPTTAADTGQAARTATAGAPAPPSGAVTLRTLGGANLRSGPGVTFAPSGALPPGSEVTATGRNPDSTWVQVQATAGSGWVAAELLQAVRGSIAALPVVAATGTGATAVPSVTAPARTATVPATASRTPATATATATRTPTSVSRGSTAP